MSIDKNIKACVLLKKNKFLILCIKRIATVVSWDFTVSV